MPIAQGNDKLVGRPFVSGDVDRRGYAHSLQAALFRGQKRRDPVVLGQGHGAAEAAMFRVGVPYRNAVIGSRQGQGGSADTGHQTGRGQGMG